MNKPLLAVACVLLGSTASLSAQNTLFVSPTGLGDGSSWNSSATLTTALSRATAGDQIWLATGTYFTSATGDRAAAFTVPSGVSLLAGFSGSEKTAAKRNPAANPAILSGEIGSSARHDNAYTILILSGSTSETHLDGLTLRGAYANGAGAPGDAKRAGGAALVNTEGPGGTSSPVFSNCTFEANYARDGGGVYIDARAGTAAPTFVACTFRQNEADLDGGAIYNDGRRHGKATPSFVDCIFEGNVANYGGAIFNQATKGTSSPKLAGCNFRGNHAYVRGASLYNIDHQGLSRPTLVNCNFEDLLQGDEASDGLARSSPN